MTNAEKVKDIIAEQLSVDLGEVVPGANLVDNLKADSLDLVELAMVLEEAFCVEISDDQAEKIETVRDAVDLVNELTG